MQDEAKMEADAKEPETKLQLQFRPSASSQDHEISEEPPIDNVRGGTPPGNQNQTREQDSNPLSISPPSSMFQSTVIMSHGLNKYTLNLITTYFCRS